MSNNDTPVQFIRLRGVSKTYRTPSGEFTALSAVNAEFGRGQFVAIVGKSGSGKSTLLNLIAGIDRPSEGEIQVGDTRVQTLGKARSPPFGGET